MHAENHDGTSIHKCVCVCVCFKDRRVILVCPGKHVVNNGHELHNPLVEVQVLQALEEVSVLAAIGAHHGNLLRLGLGGKHRHFQTERLQQHGLKRGKNNKWPHCQQKSASTSHLILLGVAWHGDAGGLNGGQVWTDLIQAKSCLQPFLSPVHQHLLKLMREKKRRVSGWQ